jgi:hypothetical protein
MTTLSPTLTAELSELTADSSFDAAFAEETDATFDAPEAAASAAAEEKPWYSTGWGIALIAVGVLIFVGGLIYVMSGSSTPAPSVQPPMAGGASASRKWGR